MVCVKVAMIKKWLLNKNDISNIDVTWIKSFSSNVEIITDTEQFSVSGSSTNFNVVVKRDVIITTDCEQHEAMLKLKYGDRMISISREFI